MRLVDADALLDRIPNLYERREVSRWFDDAPTVDAVPVRHGRWVMMEGELAFWDKCSECGKKILHRTPYYDFCPNCGADMRKDGDDGKTD